MKHIFAILISTLLFSTSYGTCGSNRSAIYFANGMFNDRIGATASLSKLMAQFKKSYPKKRFEVQRLSFNTNEFFLIQIHQVFRQKITDMTISFWQHAGKWAERTLIRHRLNLELEDLDLKLQIREYTKTLKSGLKVIVVAHSQGNLYTNFALSSLPEKSPFMISVATPASYVFKNGPYFTFKSDKVISSIPTALPPNLTKEHSGAFDHEFVNDYLEDSQTRIAILKKISEAFDEHKSNLEASLNPNDGYLNSDMTPILDWFNTYLKSKRQLTNSECILVESLFHTYRLFNRTCEKRNYETFKQSVDDCSKDFETADRPSTDCPYWRGISESHVFELGYPLEADEHYSLNPHCRITAYQEFQKWGQTSTLEARKIAEKFRENQ